MYEDHDPGQSRGNIKGGYFQKVIPVDSTQRHKPVCIAQTVNARVELASKSAKLVVGLAKSGLRETNDAPCELCLRG